MDQPRPLFSLFSVFQTDNTIFNNKCHIHPVYGAGIRTHNLSNLSHLPYPLDQGSHPGSDTLSVAKLLKMQIHEALQMTGQNFRHTLK